ncbi:MAG TPA: cyclohexa-1,5-dienecarbonyl-CoA hydratase [Nannocystis exedens]|nr:cyclohexa-1,5-dienecarbonyl-CoA hydratase [Nannocystis exedens]
MILSEVRMQGAELRITLNRPKANILDAEMIAAISSALDQHVSERTALIVFEGQGKHFCFGASVEEHRAEQASAMLTSFHALFKKLAELAIPTCAIVRGQCLGGGLELASWCTWIIAEPGATLGQPEIKLAVFPPMASILLPWRCGGAQGLDLCVSGRSISAERALEIGLVNAVTDDPETWLKSHIIDMLARTSASSLRFAEKAARIGLVHDIEHHLPTLERLYVHELMATHDANEGIAAFLERRKPTFKHS